MMGAQGLTPIVITVGLLTAGLLGAPPATAARVCIPLLSGTQCVDFLEGRPTKPGLSKGMSASMTPQELTGAGDVTMRVSGFRPREGLRLFNYNIFGQNRMVEYSAGTRRADGKGGLTWTTSPSTAIYEQAWGRPALCAYGMRSGRLACASFSVAADTADPLVPATPPNASGDVPVPPVAPPTPAPSPSSASNPGENCVDYGFTTLCTG